RRSISPPAPRPRPHRCRRRPARPATAEPGAHMSEDQQEQSAPVSTTRRSLIKAGAVAGGSLLFGFSLFGCDKKGAGQDGDRKQAPPEKAVGQAATNMSGEAPGLAHDAFIRIDREGIAKVRTVLVQAAAQNWNVKPEELKVVAGTVRHDASNRSANFGELVDAASKLNFPATVKLKNAADFTLIGKPVKRLDSPAKTNGSAQF